MQLTHKFCEKNNYREEEDDWIGGGGGEKVDDVRRCLIWVFNGKELDCREE